MRYGVNILLYKYISISIAMAILSRKQYEALITELDVPTGRAIQHERIEKMFPG